jgi:hypothetical protein
VRNIFQDPVALCKSEFIFHSWRVCAISVGVHSSSSLYCKSHYIFQSNWRLSSVQVHNIIF